MSITFTLNDVKRVSRGIWLAELSPDEIGALGPPVLTYGSVSIVLVLQHVVDAQDRIGFSMPVKVLNRGSSKYAVFIDANSYREPEEWQRVVYNAGDSNPPPSESEGTESPGISMGPGDTKFLQGLPPELKRTGELLLSRVREWHSGQLIYHDSSKKFVETPNFWAVVIQPRDVSLRVTVYGSLDNYSESTLDLKRDLPSYTSFKIDREDQVDEAARIIRKAYALKQSRQMG
ncbi:hypothetical protein [Thioalkalivibrio sp. XN8]|uniref:hypothetical protein n=1 Tax=Thioalkalivibrio sp. XN8 TaxID=2712863 RepID=UPI0013EBF5A0|nr:hypothetical protein [Thioalkalivibrio sp. XN8]NGP52121.1 hypothetical protein [Thioalkalivibrio sp. XN8]